MSSVSSPSLESLERLAKQQLEEKRQIVEKKKQDEAKENALIKQRQIEALRQKLFQDIQEALQQNSVTAPPRHVTFSRDLDGETWSMLLGQPSLMQRIIFDVQCSTTNCTHSAGTLGGLFCLERYCPTCAKNDRW